MPHDLEKLQCEECDEFCCHCELCDCCKKTFYERDRWREIADTLLETWCSTYGISRERAIEKYYPEFDWM